MAVTVTAPRAYSIDSLCPIRQVSFEACALVERFNCPIDNVKVEVNGIESTPLWLRLSSSEIVDVRLDCYRDIASSGVPLVRRFMTGRPRVPTRMWTTMPSHQIRTTIDLDLVDLAIYSNKDDLSTSVSLMPSSITRLRPHGCMSVFPGWASAVEAGDRWRERGAANNMFDLAFLQGRNHDELD